jgi:aminoglycoside 6'-N-acetyltransferase I
VEGGESMITYRKATLADVDIIANFGRLLYSSDNTFDKLKHEANEHLCSGKWAVFLAFDGNVPVGLCEISLRSDYVEGTKGGVVGYIEGVCVLPEYRNQHIAKSLIKLGEKWSRENGCVEFASDCLLDNTESLCFHLKIGFEEAGRNIHFVKKLED